MRKFFFLTVCTVVIKSITSFAYLSFGLKNMTAVEAKSTPLSDILDDCRMQQTFRLLLQHADDDGKHWEVGQQQPPSLFHGFFCCVILLLV